MPESKPATPDSPPQAPSFREALRWWLRLGCISFGGPAGQIAIMHREVVDRRRWISEDSFLHALNFCMLLPGPEAQQLATWIGWRLHGWRGGVAAGALFVIPSAILLFALSWLFMAGGQMPWLAAIFYGLMPAVIAIIAEAVLRIGKKALRSPVLWLIAAASLVAIRRFDISFVLILLSAAGIGWLGSRVLPAQFPASGGHGAGKADAASAIDLPPAPAASLCRSLGVLGVTLALWGLPLLATGMLIGWQSTTFRQGAFFSQAALVTFGGAYAVLPYVAQRAVENFGWLSHPQMMSGLALAETTPGPLIMVLQFVGFAGGWQHPPEGFSPLAAAAMGAAITTWCTFLPSFLFVFLGAPHVEKLRQQPGISAALTAITAAVVGVILNLGVQFASHALLAGDRPDWFVAVAAVAAFAVLKFTRTPMLAVIAGCGMLGLVWRLAIL